MKRLIFSLLYLAWMTSADVARAEDWYEREYDWASLSAADQFEFAKIYLHGARTQPNIWPISARLFESAYQQRPSLSYDIGEYHEREQHDFRTAMRWYERAIASGDDRGHVPLAALSFSGWFGSADYTRALTHLSASPYGFRSSNSHLYDAFYRRSEYIHLVPETADLCYREIVRRGDAAMLLVVASRYLNGDFGINDNRAWAYAWWRVAQKFRLKRAFPTPKALSDLYTEERNLAIALADEIYDDVTSDQPVTRRSK